MESLKSGCRAINVALVETGIEAVAEPLGRVAERGVGPAVKFSGSRPQTPGVRERNHEDGAMSESTSDTSSQPTMRAISQDELGGPEVLHEVQLPIPKPGPSQILIRVHAAGMNPTDWKHRGHRAFLPAPPFVLGWDVSGVVEQVGVGVTLFEPGDEVFGMLPYPFGVGAHAEYARTDPCLRPEAEGHRPCAGRSDSPCSTDRVAGSRRHRRGGRGDRVLIHAAAGEWAIWPCRSQRPAAPT